MATGLKGWWPLATVGGSASQAPPQEQLEDLEDILGEPGADAALPVSSRSHVVEEPSDPAGHQLFPFQHRDQPWQQQQQQTCQPASAHAASVAVAAEAPVPMGATDGSGHSTWSSHLSGVSSWFAGTGQQAQQQAQQQQQQGEAAVQESAGWRHYLPSMLPGLPASSAPVQRQAEATRQADQGQEGLAGGMATAAGTVVSAAGSVATAAVHAVSATTSATTALAAAAQHQLSSACEQVAASTVGATVVGAAVGGLVAGPLGAAAGAKSGAALVAAGALGGAAAKHVRDVRAVTADGLAAGLAGEECSSSGRELQPWSNVLPSRETPQPCTAPKGKP